MRNLKYYCGNIRIQGNKIIVQPNVESECIDMVIHNQYLQTGGQKNKFGSLGRNVGSLHCGFMVQLI